jgi:hypothetical protein
MLTTRKQQAGKVNVIVQILTALGLAVLVGVNVDWGPQAATPEQPVESPAEEEVEELLTATPENPEMAALTKAIAGLTEQVGYLEDVIKKQDELAVEFQVLKGRVDVLTGETEPPDVPDTPTNPDEPYSEVDYCQFCKIDTAWNDRGDGHFKCTRCGAYGGPIEGQAAPAPLSAPAATNERRRLGILSVRCLRQG